MFGFVSVQVLEVASPTLGHSIDLANGKGPMAYGIIVRGRNHMVKQEVRPEICTFITPFLRGPRVQLKQHQQNMFHWPNNPVRGFASEKFFEPLTLHNFEDQASNT